MYRSDLLRLFNVLPVEVLRRIVLSFVPGHHSALLTSPDLYGPLLSVFLMPQVALHPWYSINTCGE